MSRKKKKLPPFVAIGRLTMKTREWIELSASAKLVYFQLKYHFNGRNNGKIAVSMRTLAKEINLDPTTVNRAIKELIQKEWIEKTEYGGLFNNLNSYKLTGKHDNWIIDETKRYEGTQMGNIEYQNKKKQEELKQLINTT
ncbi:MAG: helix-turn-helix domain-containing protein [Candidatus Firestonebacteria bacterium]